MVDREVKGRPVVTANAAATVAAAAVEHEPAPSLATTVPGVVGDRVQSAWSS